MRGKRTHPTTAQGQVLTMKLAQSTVYAPPFFLQLFLLGQAPQVWIEQLRVSYNGFFCCSSESGVGSYPKEIKATSYFADLVFVSWQILRANFVIEPCSLRKIFHTLCSSKGSTDCRWPGGLVPGGYAVSTASHILQSDCSD